MFSSQSSTSSADPAEALMASTVDEAAQNDDCITLDTLLETITSLHAEASSLVESTEVISKTVSSLLTDPEIYIDNTPGFMRGNWIAFRRAVESGNFEGQKEDGIAALKSAMGKWEELNGELKDAQRPLELVGIRMDTWKGFVREVQNDLGREAREEREKRERGEERCWESCQACGGGEERNSPLDAGMPEDDEF